jgi:hypothetical protein
VKPAVPSQAGLPGPGANQPLVNRRNLLLMPRIHFITFQPGNKQLMAKVMRVTIRLTPSIHWFGNGKSINVPPEMGL